VTAISPHQLAFLRQFGFDAALQQRWQADVKTGRLAKQKNLLAGPLTAPPPGTIEALPSPGSPAARDLERIGKDAIARGELGVVVLNGGMATRFGGVVKGVVPVLSPSRSFLALVVEDLRRVERETGGRVPLFLMNSFATDAATKAHFAERGNFGAPADRITHFTQFVALRMQQDGELFQLQNGEVSPYGPGHGDFPGAFRACSAMARFRKAGGRHLLVRNVDNLGARVDPLLLGHHIANRRQATVELAPKWPEDVGGAPYTWQGRVQLIEGLRFPPGFDPNIVDVFNTNTLWFDASAIDREFELGRYYVEKTVEDRKAVQIEHLIGELTAHLDTGYLRVTRDGRGTRFLPVKAPDDLDTARPAIRTMYEG
jgi:UTP--glucose-1-phosphate uridylyltransferase